MTLSKFFQDYGLDGLRKLASEAGTSVGYLYQLIYDDSRIPSRDLSRRLVAASKRKLTIDGLKNPVRLLVGHKGRSGRRAK